MRRIFWVFLPVIAGCFLMSCSENETIGQIILHNQTDGEISWSSTAISEDEDYWSSTSIDGSSFGWVMSRVLPGRVMEIKIEDFVKNLDEAEVRITLTRRNGDVVVRVWTGYDRSINTHTPFNPQHSERSHYSEVSGRNHVIYDFYVTEEDFMPENRME